MEQVIKIYCQKICCLGRPLERNNVKVGYLIYKLKVVDDSSSNREQHCLILVDDSALLQKVLEHDATQGFRFMRNASLNAKRALFYE